MHFANPLPWWGLLLVGAGAVWLALHAYRAHHAVLGRARLAVLVALRVVTLGALVVFLMRPVAPVPPRQSTAAWVPVLVDVSRSMTIHEPGGRTRLERARDLVARLRPDLERRWRVELFTLGDGLQSVDALPPTPTDARSDLGPALEELRDRLRGRETAGVVVISDGGDTGTGSNVAAWQQGPPIVTVGVGEHGPRRDREVRSLTAGQSSLDGSLVDLTISGVAPGDGGRPLPVRLLQGNRVVEQKLVRPVAEGSPFQVTFTVAPGRDAPELYAIELPAAADELTTENNRAEALVTPPGRRRRILMIEGAPGFEHAFLKRAWAEDPSLELDSVVRKGRNDQGTDTYFVQATGSRTAALAQGFPEARNALFVYDVIVLANLEPDTLTRAQMSLVNDFVAERGGGLLLVGARSFAGQGLANSPLEAVLPLRLDERGGLVRATNVAGGDRFKVQPTPEGERHPLMRIGPNDEDSRRRWAALPTLAGAVALGDSRPGASVLAVTRAGGSAVPVVAVQRFGGGRSMLFTGEAAWRWRMLLPSSDQTYERFWRQSVRWLSAEAPDPVAVTVPQSVAPGEEMTIDVLVRDAEYRPALDAAPTVDLTLPGGEVRRLAPTLVDSSAGRYTARVRVTDRGVHRVAVEAHRGGAPLGGASRQWLVGGLDPEMSDARLNEAVLRRLSEASGGQYVGEADAATVGSLLHRLRPAAPPAELQDLWHAAWTFVALIALLSAEWVLRRRWGLR
jgi:uncharacterized membrane protein